jgi:hypothetical protein
MKLENSVACAIQKEIHFRPDCCGEERELDYFRNKEGKKVDDCIATNGILSLWVEESGSFRIIAIGAMNHN